MISQLRIIVTGLMAQHRLLGGVAWGCLNYILGLARLGHDVYYVEDSGQWPYNLDGGPAGDDWIANDCTPNVEYLAKVMATFGLGDKWAYRFPIQPKWYGLGESGMAELLQTADLLLNHSGTLEHPEKYRSIPRLAYIDTDPVFTQIEVAEGRTELKNRVDVHDIHFSIGECLAAPVPETGHRWRPTRPPIVLSEWRTLGAPRPVFTTVMNWTSYTPVCWRGETYGQKDVEFMQFMELPSKVDPTILEVALPRLHHKKWQTRYSGLPAAVENAVRTHSTWSPHDLLAHFRWRPVDAIQVGVDFERYRHYIQCSRAEWSIAKNGYVRGQSGWFSNRSACYLAAGRPVVVQDTGFASVLPVGEGILPFRTVEEAAASIREVEGAYVRHSRSAQAIAEEYFNSDKVLTRLVEEALGGLD